MVEMTEATGTVEVVTQRRGQVSLKRAESLRNTFDEG